MKVPQIAPMGSQRRQSSEAVWPLRSVNGLTWAESKAAKKGREAA